MNKPMQHRAGYWGTKTDFASLLDHVRKIGPVLEANAEANDELGRLNEATFEALKSVEGPRLVAARRSKRVADIIGATGNKRDAATAVAEAANG